MNKIDLQGRSAIVTGGAEGIGFAIAERLLASGASISLWDSNQETLTTARDKLNTTRKVHIYPVDVSDAEVVQRATELTEQALGGVDILVANAGITGPNAKCWEYPLNAWKRVMEVNLNGVFYCCRAVVPLMLKHGCKFRKF